MTPVRRFTVCGVVRGIPDRQSRVRNNPGGPIPPPPPAPRPLPAGQQGIAVTAPPPPPPPLPSANPDAPCGIATAAIQDPVGTVQMTPLDGWNLRPRQLNATGNRFNAVPWTASRASSSFAMFFQACTAILRHSSAIWTRRVTVDVRNRDVENVALLAQSRFPFADPRHNGRACTRSSASQWIDHADRQQSSNARYIAKSTVDPKWSIHFQFPMSARMIRVCTCCRC